jgi:serine phosphatase RsbU (regulator of sigma subunit)
LILVFGLVALGLPLALVAQLGIVRTLNTTNAEIAQIRQGQLALAAVLQYQLDEETGLRGYAATHRTAFLEPYLLGRAAMPERLAELESVAASAGARSTDDQRRIAGLRRINSEWLRVVADPILAGTRDQDNRLLRGKALIDRFRAEVRYLDARFAARYAATRAKREGTIRTTALVSVLALIVIALEVIAFGVVIMRMQRELDRERGFVETLQSATSVRLLPPPHLAIGTAYRSATRGTRVGGDLYDVYRLDPSRTLLVVGDASGKGLAAAVDTTFVRFAVRALAAEGLSPAEIMRRFDALYRDANLSSESFVTLFVGVHDRDSGLLRYANAGHEACWLRRRDGTVVMLPPTGPIVGLGGYPFDEAQVPLGPGDLLLLATDGLTEARDPRGRFIALDRITGWIAGAGGVTPQAIVDELVARVKRYARGRIADDLAILAVRPLA